MLRDLMSEQSFSRWLGVRSLESVTPLIGWWSGENTTAATVSGPARLPLPTSSAPTIIEEFCCQ